MVLLDILNGLVRQQVGEVELLHFLFDQVVPVLLKDLAFVTVLHWPV